ncbi:hypothetical protein yc1106_08577 [Curvularia clavata]|uniref:Uncharacterized protein n=1 Tax=Curvularia clavata TaxID=95742 RepID=A0A9Q8ZJK8_CURCL|nr:hypothetical protein yc1106_08577 [Curvularia clavata]
MKQSQVFNSALVALASYVRLSFADDTSNENIALLDCGFDKIAGHPDWASSFAANYYAGDIWQDAEETKVNPPTGTAVVSAADGAYPWREEGTTFKLLTTDITVTIHPAVNDPSPAGLLTRSEFGDKWNCFAYHKTIPGECRITYVCNKKDHPHPAARDKIAVKFSITKDFAKLSGNINPADVYGKIHYGDNGMCDESWTEVPGGCKIKFRCHGNKKGTTPAMAKALKDIGNGFPDMIKHENVNERTWDPCKSGRDTCIGGYVDKYVDYTWVPQTLSIVVSDANDADQGELSYEMDCSSGPQCDMCTSMKWGANFAAWVAGVIAPELGFAGNLLAQSVSGSCLANGC